MIGRVFLVCARERARAKLPSHERTASPISHRPTRLLCGPGPTNVDPAALAAMQKPMLGHLDPELHEILLDVVDILRLVYRAESGLVLPLQSTGTSGMEAGLANLVEPGETVIVGSAAATSARGSPRSRGAAAREVRRGVSADWGDHVPNERLLDGARRAPRRAPAGGRPRRDVDRQRASAGAELGAAMRGRRHAADGGLRDHAGRRRARLRRLGDRLRLLVHPEVPRTRRPGCRPVAVSDRALERIARPANAGPVLDGPQLLLQDYWVERPATYHHTAPILHIYALHEALRQTLDGGSRAPLGQAHRGRDLPAAAGLAAAGFELAGRTGPPARAADRGPGARREWTGSPCSGSSSRGGDRGRAAASARRLPRCGGSG